MSFMKIGKLILKFIQKNKKQRNNQDNFVEQK